MKEINAEELKGNLIEMINKKWALVTAGDHEKANTMTVSWGSFGEFWSKPVITIYIRPQRYTKQFIGNTAIFRSVCCKVYRKALVLLMDTTIIITRSNKIITPKQSSSISFF